MMSSPLYTRRWAHRRTTCLLALQATLLAVGLSTVGLSTVGLSTVGLSAAGTSATPSATARPAPATQVEADLPQAATSPRHKVAVPKQRRPVPASRQQRTRQFAGTTTSTALRPAPRANKAARTTPTGWAALDAAIADLPGGGRTTRWVVTSSYKSWGTADWYHETVFISPSVPERYLYDVVVHEWSHLRSVVAYGGNVDLAVRAMNSFYGGSGLEGAESAADCMARLRGATWTSYTPCDKPAWRSGAARLLRGEQL